MAEKVKKLLRDDGGVMSDERREALAGELGDVLWYVAQVATEAGLDLEEIAQANLDAPAERGCVGASAARRARTASRGVPQRAARSRLMARNRASSVRLGPQRPRRAAHPPR